MPLIAAVAAMHNFTAPADATITTLFVFPPADQASIDQRLDRSRNDTFLRSPFQRRPSRAALDSAPKRRLKASCDVKALSTLPLPEKDSMIEDSWTESLLRLSLDEHEPG